MKNLLLFLSLILLCACSSDDTTEPFTLSDKIYKMVSFEVETNMDLNDDGIFSTDLLIETSPYCNNALSNMDLYFNANGTIFYPWNTYPDFHVNDDISSSGCGFLSNAPQAYDLKESTVEFVFPWDGNQLILIGELSENNSKIVTSYNPSEMHGELFNGEFINETGELENYTGNYILTYELQN